MQKLLLIPGPTNLSESVRKTMSLPQISHTGKEFYTMFLETLQLARYVFDNTKGYQFVFTGTGTTGMETSVYSLLGHGDKALVLNTGYFGKRFVLINKAHKVEVDQIEYESGKHADPDDLRKALSKEKYKAVFITHVDTSTGIKNPVKELVEECNKADVFSVVDSVCGVGGEQISFDRLGADVVFTASQKALAGPPGAVLIAVSERAMEYIESRKDDIESYYMNLARWKPIMDDPKIYLATPATQVITALREALLELKDEGLEKRWKRHERLAEMTRKAFDDSAIDVVAEEGFRANTVTGVWIKSGKAEEIQKELEERHNIVIARGIGEDKDRMIRIGHMGILEEETLHNALTKIVPTVLEVSKAKLAH
jgi:alanine-glyoxylate transaminase/serine-glyoxylate transaminase/serine-pyruvate transaminase